MSFKNISTTLSADVPPGGTFTLNYPVGTNAGSFSGGVGHRLQAGQASYVNPQDFGVTFGASNITITNRKAAVTWRAGTRATFQGDISGSNPVTEGGFKQPVSDVPTVMRVQDTLVILGAPAAASNVNLRAAAAIGAAGALALLLTQVDVPRNLVFVSSGNDSAITFTITSKDQYGASLSEVVTGANAGSASSVKAHYGSITVTASGAAAGTVSIGVGNALGLPVYLQASGYVIRELMNGATASAGTFVAGLSTNTASTTITTDVRGTYTPATAPNGTNAYQLIIAIPDPSYLGPAQA